MPPAGRHIELKIEDEHMHRLLRRQPFLFSGTGPERRFFRALGLQMGPSSRQSRRTRLAARATPAHADLVRKRQRAFRHTHVGRFAATV